MAVTKRAVAIERTSAALALISEQAGALGILLERLHSRPDPDAEIQEANLTELLLALADAQRVQAILLQLHHDL